MTRMIAGPAPVPWPGAAAWPPVPARSGVAGTGGEQLTVSCRDDAGSREGHLDAAAGRVLAAVPGVALGPALGGSRLLRLPGEGAAVLAVSGPGGEW